MKITILTESGRWFLKHRERLQSELERLGNKVHCCTRYEEIVPGDVAFILGSGTIIPREVLKRNRHNLVAHASALPRGKGSTPLTWQILEGAAEIPVTLFEAVEKMDSGDIYFLESIKLQGHELLPEMHELLGEKIIELCLKFVQEYPRLKGKPQQGEESFYRRRKPQDSQVDPSKSLLELFNLFRVADNENYPVFFRYRNHAYKLKIEKIKE